MEISVEPYIENITMPENLKVGLMVKKQRELCKSVGCDFDYFGLAFGQSPFPLPPLIQRALVDNADKNHYSDPEGIPKLREAISLFNKHHFGLDVDPSRVIVGPGTKDLIHTIFRIINGDVIIPSPSWIGYNPQIILLDKKFHTFHLKPEYDYKIQPSDLEEFLSKLPKNQRTLILNNPHNPTGSVYSRDELVKIADVCRKNETLILADEIYSLLTFEMKNFTSMGLIYPEGTFITNGLSKDRSAAGYRLGSCILPEGCSEKLKGEFKKVSATVYTNVSTPIQYAAITAYQPNDEIDNYMNTARKIHRTIGQYLSSEYNKIDGIKATTPYGGFYFFVDLNELAPQLRGKNINTSNQLGESLISCPHHLATVTGDACLLDPDDFGARIAFIDYEGKETFDSYKNNLPKTKSEEEEFVKQNAPMMVSSIRAMRDWVDFIKKP